MTAQAHIDDVVDLVAGDQLLGFGPVQRPFELLAPEVGPLPNLGYFATISLNVPVWDWGSRSSKVRQAELKRDRQMWS